MVKEQLVARGIKDERVLKAFIEVPREQFIGVSLKSQSYSDSPLPIGKGQTISQPYTVAFMTELLKLKGNEKVLEVGTGSGYQAAILSKLCKKVYTIENLPRLYSQAVATLSTLGFKNVEVFKGDGSLGLIDKSPFDAIIVTAAAPSIPPSLISQLARGGKLVIPVGDRAVQQMVRITKRGDDFKKETFGGFRFVPLIGREGWTN